MALSMEQLRAAFKKNESGESRPNNYYPFWNIPEGSTVQLRFLPDANSENPMGFLVEKLMHTLTINGENKSVPCLRMYGEECPICKVSSAYYKDSDKVNGKKYWRKKQHLAQALVVNDPMPPNEDTSEGHEGKVRFFALGYQLFNIMKDAFESGELDVAPYLFEGGTDFLIKRTKQGEHSSYVVGSKFDRRSYDLTEDQLATVQDQMIDLHTLIPQHPGLEKVEAMLEAALTGADYKEGNKPAASKPAPTAAAKPADDVPFEPNDGKDDTPAATTEETAAPASEFDDEADAILAQIRQRQAKKA